jgi:D-aminoacyl-tRNA deacylase
MEKRNDHEQNATPCYTAGRNTTGKGNRMRAVLQRVSRAEVRVDGVVTGSVGLGLLVLLGVEEGDTPDEAKAMADKITHVRCFSDADGKFNLSLQDVAGGVLLVSQFTLLGDCRKGTRPSFSRAARPDTAIPLYERVAECLRAAGIDVGTGVFGAHMEVDLVNDGPVTLLLDSRKVF